MKKEITKGKYILYYERFLDDMGFKKDSFDLFDTETRTHLPFFGPIKVSENARDTPINELGYSFTDDELKTILEEQIEALTHPNNK